jgi:hypothetical protein
MQTNVCEEGGILGVEDIRSAKEEIKLNEQKGTEILSSESSFDTKAKLIIALCELMTT